MKFTRKKYKEGKKAQVMLEFTFCMIILLLMMYGIIMILRWTGKSYVERQKDHEAVLTQNVPPREQLETYFHKPTPMNAIWAGDINL